MKAYSSEEIEEIFKNRGQNLQIICIRIILGLAFLLIAKPTGILIFPISLTILVTLF